MILDLSQSSPENLSMMVEDLFSNLGQGTVSSASTDEFISNFIEEAIVMAISFW